jgi:diguanylate cyclase (GGDEF)-like protein
MTRQLSELAMEKEGVKFHITSLLPIRPENRPTPLEETALKKFETGVIEIGEIINGDSGQKFFYMASLKTEKSCLGCHAKQGYREGDIRGGISITIPYTSKSQTFIIISVHIFMLFAGLSGLIFSGLKLSKAYDLIKRQAVFDALTGIPNRHSFSERILTEYKRSLRDNYPLSVIMGDIDNFKLYNDTYGHAGGDECLKSVANIIKTTLKRPGDFCARYGGEEFIIILPSTDNNGAKAIADNIRDNVFNLKISHEKSSHEKIVTISLGVATKSNDSTMTSEELLKMADDALYIAKEKGRNRVEIYNQ